MTTSLSQPISSPRRTKHHPSSPSTPKTLRKADVGTSVSAIIMVSSPPPGTVARPKMRIVEKPPQGGRPRLQGSLSAYDLSAARARTTPTSASSTSSSQATPTPSSSKTLRPLPSVPQLRREYDAAQQQPHTAPVHGSFEKKGQKIRPLPPTPDGTPLGDSLFGPGSATSSRRTSGESDSSRGTDDCSTSSKPRRGARSRDLPSVAPLEAKTKHSSPKTAIGGEKWTPEKLREPVRGATEPEMHATHSEERAPRRAPSPPIPSSQAGTTSNTTTTTTTSNPSPLSPPAITESTSQPHTQVPPETPTPPPPSSAAPPPPTPTSTSTAGTLAPLGATLVRNATTATAASSATTQGHGPYLPPSVPIPSSMPAAIPIPRAGLVDPSDTHANELLASLRQAPDRQHELILMAASISRMWTPSLRRTSLDSEGTTEQNDSEGAAVSSDAQTLVDSDASERNPMSHPDEGKAQLLPEVLGSDRTPTRNRGLSSLGAADTTQVWPLPKLVLPGIGVVEGSPRSRRDDNTLSSPVEFLNELSPWKRQTVFNIMTSLASADAEEEARRGATARDSSEKKPHSDSRTSSSSCDCDDEIDVDSQGHVVFRSDGTGEEVDGIGAKIKEITWEYAVKTGRAVRAPALIKKLSKKCMREKSGKKWAEDDYANVLNLLRRL